MSNPLSNILTALKSTVADLESHLSGDRKSIENAVKADVKAFESAASTSLSFVSSKVPDAQQAMQIAEEAILAAATGTPWDAIVIDFIGRMGTLAIGVEKAVAAVILNLAEGNLIAQGKKTA